MNKLEDIENLKIEIENIKKKLISYSKDKDPLIRSDAIEALGLFYDGDIDKIILKSLKDKNELVKVSALDNIILPKNINKVLKKIVKLLNDKSNLVKSYAVDALAYNNAKMYKNKIKRLLKEDIDNKLKVSIYCALVKFGEKKYLKKLLKLLDDEDYIIRCSTANCLYFLINKDNYKLIMKALKNRLKKEKIKASKYCIKEVITDIYNLK